jgi:hypothetical protein
MMQRHTGLIFSIYFSVFLLVSLLFPLSSEAQFLMDMVDTTKELGRRTYLTINNFNHIRISGYMQPQYQLASEKGVSNFAGGNFAPNSNNRFMIRRGRIRFDYMLTDNRQRNQMQWAFQFDGTERGVFIRDFWGRYWENKWELFSFTTGMFARPFGFEVNLSSGDRETPERGRMSQILMKTERDLGFMTSFERRRKGASWSFFRLDVGLFNGQGLTAPGEFDGYKDLIAQIVIKPQHLGKRLTAAGGLSYFHGGMEQVSSSAYRIKDENGIRRFVADSVTTGLGDKLPRIYYGANTQWKRMTAWGFTELRAEYWRGTQTATAVSTETPSVIGAFGSPMYVRPFDGAYFYFLQHIVNQNNQLLVKYDWYDPNLAVKGSGIGRAGTNFSAADIKYSTLGIGYLRNVNENLKLILYLDLVKNEITSLTGFTEDISDNVLTIRTQFRF